MLLLVSELQFLVFVSFFLDAGPRIFWIHYPVPVSFLNIEGFTCQGKFIFNVTPPPTRHPTTPSIPRTDGCQLTWWLALPRAHKGWTRGSTSLTVFLSLCWVLSLFLSAKPCPLQPGPPFPHHESIVPVETVPGSEVASWRVPQLKESLTYGLVRLDSRVCLGGCRFNHLPFKHQINISMNHRAYKWFKTIVKKNHCLESSSLWFG